MATAADSRLSRGDRNGGGYASARRPDPILKMYLDEVAKTPLLTKAQERRIGEAFLRSRTPELRELLARHNLRLVIRWAVKSRGRGMELTDLIQEGNRGLLRSIEDWDYRKGRFSTHAVWWIKQSIRRALRWQGRHVRVPDYLVDRWVRVRDAEAKFTRRRRLPPTLDEIGCVSGLTAEEVADTRAHVGTKTLQLSALGANEADREGEAQPDEFLRSRTLTPDALLEAKEDLRNLSQELLLMLKNLGEVAGSDSRLKNLFRLRYGFDDGSLEPYTLESICGRYNITRERVRQIVNKAWCLLARRGYQGGETWFIWRLERLRVLEELLDERAFIRSAALRPRVSVRGLCRGRLNGRKFSKRYVSP